MNNATNAFVKIDVQGARTIKSLERNALLIFIAPPSLMELERRLRERKADSAAQMDIRIATAKHEMDQSSWFDSVVINDTDKLEDTVEQILEIVASEQNRPESQSIRL